MSKKKYKNYYKHAPNKKKILDGIDLSTNIYKKTGNNQNNDNTEELNSNVELDISSKDKNKQINIDDRIVNKLNDGKKVDFELTEVKNEDSNNFSISGKNSNSNNINEKVQSFISILFTIIIFIALILLIIVLYNNYFKSKAKNLKIDKEKVCKEYIKKDYNIKTDDVLTFIKLNRGIFYNIDNFSNTEINSKDIMNFIVYYIWSSNLPYNICEENEGNCLVSKKEIPLVSLQEVLKEYLDYEKDIIFNNAVTNEDDIRLYLENDKVVLTFNEFMFKTYKHDFIETIVDEDNVKVIIALSKQIDETIYSYVGYKIINLKYLENRFIIKSIETRLN